MREDTNFIGWKQADELTDAELFEVGGGSQSAGAVTFNPFSITRKIDRASPIFLQEQIMSEANSESCNVREPKERELGDDELAMASGGLALNTLQI